MAARKNLPHKEKTKERIKASMLINRLTDHVLGKVELTSSQVTAALGLIKKVVPDLASVEMKADVKQTNYVVNSESMTESDWKREYSGDLGTTTGATESTH